MKEVETYKGYLLITEGVSEGEIEIYSPKEYNEEQQCSVRYIVGVADTIEDAKAQIDELQL